MEKSRRRREGGVVAACERSCLALSPLARSLPSLSILSLPSLPSPYLLFLSAPSQSLLWRVAEQCADLVHYPKEL